MLALRAGERQRQSAPGRVRCAQRIDDRRSFRDSRMRSEGPNGWPLSANSPPAVPVARVGVYLEPHVNPSRDRVAPTRRCADNAPTRAGAVGEVTIFARSRKGGWPGEWPLSTRRRRPASTRHSSHASLPRAAPRGLDHLEVLGDPVRVHLVHGRAVLEDARLGGVGRGSDHRECPTSTSASADRLRL